MSDGGLRMRMASVPSTSASAIRDPVVLRFAILVLLAGAVIVLACYTRVRSFCPGIFLARLFRRLEPNFFCVVFSLPSASYWYVLGHNRYRLSIGTSL